ncbi:MAG: hypothetical protein V4812_13670 [Pseudomonadota bacterium]
MTYLGTPSLADCSMMTMAEVLLRYPAFEQAIANYPMDYDSELLLVVEGDYRIGREWNDLLMEAETRWTLVVGNVQLQAEPWGALWVTGDLHADTVSLHTLQVLGAIHASCYALLAAEDHGRNMTSARATLHTPYLFVWFYDICNLTLDPDTLIFILSEWDYCHALQVPQPTVVWHDARFVLHEDMQDVVEEYWHDNELWRYDRIKAALHAGQPILRDGFDARALLTCRAARDADRLGDSRLAWLYYRKAFEQAPGYGPAAHQMGVLMVGQGAYEQALPYLVRAAALYPAVQTDLPNDAAIDAAMTALRLSRWDEAVAISTAAIEHNGQAATGNLFRIRGEALLLKGQREAARADLMQAIERSEQSAPSHWLLGLICAQEDRMAEAEAYRDNAAKLNRIFDVPYRDHANTHFVAKPPTSVDWPSLRLEALIPEQDDTWWTRTVLADPRQMPRVPLAMRTTALLQSLLTHQIDEASQFSPYFPAEAFTPGIAHQLVAADAQLLASIPEVLIDKALCLAARPGSRSFPVERIASDLWDVELCLHALGCGAPLKHLPQEHLTEEVCRDAVRRHAYAIQDVPAQWQSDALWILALAHGGSYFINNHAPSRYKTSAMLKQVVEVGEFALHSIPGNLFSEELYVHAKALYGNAPDWDAVVALHRPAVCLDQRKDFAEDCWLAFWDEASMLQAIQGEQDRLSPFEIPASHYTQRIADACFEAQPIHLNCIPPQFVTVEMSEHFIARYSNSLEEVPLAQRSVAICAFALLADISQTALVPAQYHAAVFDALLEEQASIQPASETTALLLVERAQGYLMLAKPDLEAAIADLQKVIGGAAAVESLLATAPVSPLEADASDQTALSDKEQELGRACYLLGYCYHLQGLPERAQRLRLHAPSSFTLDYPAFDPGQNKPKGDLNQIAFDACMHECERLIQSPNTYAAAWTSVLQAEKLLRDSGATTARLWAFMLDKKRWLTFELAHWDDNLQVCREIVQRFEHLQLWAYCTESAAIRAILRAAYHRLGAYALDTPAATLDDDRQSIALLDKAISLRGPSEEADAIESFLDARLGILHRLAAHDTRYAARFERERERLQGMPWQRFVYSELALSLLKSE